MDSAVTWSTLPYQVNKHRDVRCHFTVLSSERQSQGTIGQHGNMTGAFRPRSNTHGFIALGPYLLVKFAVYENTYKRVQNELRLSGSALFFLPSSQNAVADWIETSDAALAHHKSLLSIKALLSWASKQVCPWQYKDHASCQAHFKTAQH